MASSTVTHSYYCHSCDAEVDANLQDFTCSHCHSGFIEEVPSRSRTPAFLTQPLSPASFLSNIIGEFSQFTGFSDEDDEDMLTEEYQTRPRRSGRANAGRRSTERFTRLPSQSGVISSGVRVAQADNPFSFQFLSGFDALHGGTRNFAHSQGILENLLMLITNQLAVGPPPASEADIAQLPVIDLTVELVQQYKACSICFEDFNLDEKVTQLPCQHVYHTSCIATWLKQHATCPICRKDLNGRDTSCLNDSLGPGSGRTAGSSATHS